MDTIKGWSDILGRLTSKINNLTAGVTCSKIQKSLVHKISRANAKHFRREVVRARNGNRVVNRKLKKIIKEDTHLIDLEAPITGHGWHITRK